VIPCTKIREFSSTKMPILVLSRKSYW